MSERVRPVLRSLRVRTNLELRRFHGTPRPLPRIVIIGAQRAGTTSLYHWLGQHPQVRAPLRKEIQYLTLHWRRGIEWYRRHFPELDDGEVTFEASPYYLFHPSAPWRAAAAYPSTTRFVALLREPVSRARSHHRLNVANGLEPLDFGPAVTAEPVRLTSGRHRGTAHRLYSYVGRGRYAEQLERWHRACPDRVLPVLAEELFADPATAFAEILDFAGLDPWTPGRFDVHSPVRSGPQDALPDALQARLRAAFAADNASLARFLGRDLSVWEPYAPAPALQPVAVSQAS